VIPTVAKKGDVRFDAVESAAGIGSHVLLYDLASGSSLASSWLESFHIRQVRKEESTSHQHVDIAIRFLGPYQDRRILLHYEGVQGYSIYAQGATDKGSLLHGDVLTHELRKAGGNYEHEIVFEAGHRFVVKFRKLRHWEEMMSKAET
jgi:hypothetical protein